jgi:class 3 adenylate cyclase
MARRGLGWLRAYPLRLASSMQFRQLSSALRADESARTASPQALVDKFPVDAAERRGVTVLFSDLVGSTALSVRLDPEDLRELIAAYQHCVAGTVRRFGGFWAKYMGDGVLVYFGYPQAHEALSGR